VAEKQWQIRESSMGLEIPLHVQPRARREEMAGLYNGAVKLRVTAPPVDDAANRAVIEFFAARLAVPRSQIHIVAGLRSREKILRIESMTLKEFRRRLPEAGLFHEM